MKRRPRKKASRTPKRVTVTARRVQQARPRRRTRARTDPVDAAAAALNAMTPEERARKAAEVKRRLSARTPLERARDDLELLDDTDADDDGGWIAEELMDPLPIPPMQEPEAHNDYTSLTADERAGLKAAYDAIMEAADNYDLLRRATARALRLRVAAMSKSR